MKKLFLAIISLSVISVYAQDKKWDFHAEAGITSSKVTTQIENKAKAGFVLYFGAQYHINDYIGVESGLQYSYTPIQFDYVEDISTTDFTVHKYDVNYNRLSIPVLFKGYLMPTNKDGLNIFAGPQVDFALSEEGETNGYAANFDEVTRGVTISGVIGVGYDFKCGLTLSLSQTFGLSGVNKAPSNGIYASNFPSSSKLNYTALRVGFKF